MQKYKVKITKILEMTVEVEAENESSAEQQINDKWRNSEYILDADNFIDVTFEVENYETAEVTASC
jgi:hypothetical protein